MNKTGLAEQARKEVSPIWKAIYKHPFIEEIESGKLSKEKLKTFVKQDYIFLTAYVRCMALAGYRTSNFEDTKWFLKLSYVSLASEIPAQLKFANSLGLEKTDLDKVRPLPNCLEYMKHLDRVCQTGTSEDIVSSLLPCAWTYSELSPRILKGLSRHYGLNADALEWWHGYTTNEYRSLVDEMKLMLSRTLSKKNAQDIKAYFRTSSILERGFWDMAYKS